MTPTMRALRAYLDSPRSGFPPTPRSRQLAVARHMTGWRRRAPYVVRRALPPAPDRSHWGGSYVMPVAPPLRLVRDEGTATYERAAQLAGQETWTWSS